MRSGTNSSIFKKYLAMGGDGADFNLTLNVGIYKNQVLPIFALKSPVRIRYGAENYLKLRCGTSYIIYNIFSARGLPPGVRFSFFKSKCFLLEVDFIYSPKIITILSIFLLFQILGMVPPQSSNFTLRHSLV